MEERNFILDNYQKKKLIDTKTIKKRPRIPKSHCQIFIINNFTFINEYIILVFRKQKT